MTRRTSSWTHCSRYSRHAYDDDVGTLTTATPPGASSRRTSRNAPSGSSMCSSEWCSVTRSNSPSTWSRVTARSCARAPSRRSPDANGSIPITSIGCTRETASATIPPTRADVEHPARHPCRRAPHRFQDHRECAGLAHGQDAADPRGGGRAPHDERREHGHQRELRRAQLGRVDHAVVVGRVERCEVGGHLEQRERPARRTLAVLEGFPGAVHDLVGEIPGREGLTARQARQAVVSVTPSTLLTP